MISLKDKNEFKPIILKMAATAITFIAFFAAMFGVMYVYYSTRHKERLALIEKSADASLFNTGKGARFRSENFL